MKKITLIALTTSLLAGVAFASDINMGHNMMNHNNMMKAQKMNMQEMCAKYHNLAQKENAKVNNPQFNNLQKMYAPEEFSG